MSIQRFKIRPGASAEARKEFLKKTLAIVIIAVFGVLVVVFLDTKTHSHIGITLPIVTGFIALTFFFSLQKALKRQQELLDSYLLTIGENTITREQSLTPTITLQYSDITAITRNSSGGFVVKTQSSASWILIPAQIDDYEKLEQLLNAIKPVTAGSGVSTLQWLNVFFVAGLVLTVYVSGNKIVIATSGVLLMALLVYSFYGIQRNKSISSDIKRKMWLVLPAVLILIINIYIKLTRG